MCVKQAVRIHTNFYMMFRKAVLYTRGPQLTEIVYEISEISQDFRLWISLINYEYHYLVVRVI